MPTITFYDVRWIELAPDYDAEQPYDGPYGPSPEDYDAARVEEHDFTPDAYDLADHGPDAAVIMATDFLKSAGLWQLSGCDAYDPDGSRTIDYATGEESAVSARLNGFTTGQLSRIAQALS